MAITVLGVSAASPSAAKLFDIFCYVEGKPDPGEAVCVIPVPSDVTVTFQANFVNSRGGLDANPTSTATYTVYVSGSSIGTFSISTGGVFTWATNSGAAQTAPPNSEIKIKAPTVQDATLSGVRFCLAATR